MSAALRIGTRPGLRPRHVDQMAVHDEVLLAGVVAVLLLGVAALSAIGASTVARPLFMLAALTIAFAARRRSPWLYLDATLWFWLTTALVRRLIEWRSGYVASDIVLITPNLLALLIVPDILTCRGLLARRGAGYALLLSGCVLYGLSVSFVRGDLLAGCLAAADWVVPLLYLFLFICHAPRIEEALPHLLTFLAAALPFVLGYALYQYFLLPQWDALWMLNSGMGSIGMPLPMTSRVFGCMNNPGILAIWLGTCLVLLAHLRNRLLLALIPFVLLLLAIGQVRSVYLSTLMAGMVGALISRGGLARLLSIIVLAGITGFVAVAVLDPQVTEQVLSRVQSMHNLDADNSALERRQIYAETPKLIDASPFGIGIGAQGRGQIAQASRNPSTVNIDSGPLSVFLALGWVAGPLYVAAILMLQVRVLGIGRRHGSPAAAAMAAAAVCALGTFPFLNILGFSAVILWTCQGYALAVEIHATPPRRTYGRAGGARRPAAAWAGLRP